MERLPEVHHKPGSRFAQFVIDRCALPLSHGFRPVWWASSALLQTVLASVVRSRLPEMRYRRQLLDCEDGGLVSLDWLEDSNETEPDCERSKRPIALLFPGLIGDSQSEYLRYLGPALRRLGFRVAAFNNRGLGGLELRTSRLYCAANCQDLELALGQVRRENPEALLVATGFSMGAIVLARHLCDRASEAQPDAAILVSASYDLLAGSRYMEQGLRNKFIGRIMSKALARVLLRNKEPLSRVPHAEPHDQLGSGNRVDWQQVANATSLRQLDACFTCPMWNFSDPDEYCIAASNGERMERVAVPTLALNAADDLFAPYATLPLNKLSESTLFVVTQAGGHLGFMDSSVCPFFGDRLIEQLHAALATQTRPSLAAMRATSASQLNDSSSVVPRYFLFTLIPCLLYSHCSSANRSGCPFKDNGQLSLMSCLLPNF